MHSSMKVIMRINITPIIIIVSFKLHCKPNEKKKTPADIKQSRTVAAVQFCYLFILSSIQCSLHAIKIAQHGFYM